MANRRSESNPAVRPAKPALKAAGKAPAAPVPRKTRRAKNEGNSVATAAAVTEDARRAMIAEAAYFHAEQRGFAPGGEEQDWLIAEAEIDALLKVHAGLAQ